jgi:hypothetical protein
MDLPFASLPYALLSNTMAGFAQSNLRRVAGRPSLRAALATKQSIAATKKKEGLLRGACHRARIRATRSVIASEAKQSIKPQRKFGLLRRFAPSTTESESHSLRYFRIIYGGESH